ncbi:PPR_long domain-containing protein [Pycnococcus provasolii]|mmetsp:Transcript_11430/g.28962  ORF Transcript_11430/g.28962 Transcript_11430/m.28962 type:complete len:256 (+) Transcript_11430:53-820(+)
MKAATCRKPTTAVRQLRRSVVAPLALERKPLKAAAAAADAAAFPEQWESAKTPKQRVDALLEVSVDDRDDEWRTNLLTMTTSHIKELGRKRRAKEAIEALTTLGRNGVKPDTVAATALLDACSRSGEVELTKSVFDRLFRPYDYESDDAEASTSSLIAPDEVTFTILLRTLMKTEPPQWSAASALLIKMEHEYGMPPSTNLFNILLYTCARVNDTDRGLALLDKMQDIGVPADEGSLAAVSKRKALRAQVKRMLR